nr:mitogen-activated protein kinase kinase kinase 3-like isoform X2 [Hydra vulgaris]
MNEESFRTNMMKVAKNLTKEDIKYIKFNYNKKIGEGVLEKIDSAIELLTILEQQGFLNYNNYEPFAKLLIQLGKQQLVKDCFPANLSSLSTDNGQEAVLLNNANVKSSLSTDNGQEAVLLNNGNGKNANLSSLSTENGQEAVLLNNGNGKNVNLFSLSTDNGQGAVLLNNANLSTLSTDNGQGAVLLNNANLSSLSTDNGQGAVLLNNDELNLDQLNIENSKSNEDQLIFATGYAKIYVRSDKNAHKKIALKCIDIGNIVNNVKAKEAAEKFNHEISLFKRLNHERIVKYYGASFTSTTISIKMEFMEGGSLHDKISNNGPLDESTASKISNQILDGLVYLHSKNIIHRDIKSANILLDLDGNCKLADFGVSKQIQTIRSYAGCKSTAGTSYYMSPETITASVNNSEYGKKADIWSFGCTVLEMLTTKLPWSHLEETTAMFYIAYKLTKPDLPENLSSSCVKFVYDCFIREPASRPNALQLKSYDWIKR